MAEVITFFRQSVRVPANRVVAALAALKKAHTEESLSTAKSDSDAIKGAKNLTVAMRALGFIVVTDAKQDVVRIECEETVRAGTEERVFQAIAPFVDKGSFIDLQGHPEEGPVRYAWNGKVVARRRVKMKDREWQEYMEKHEAELDAAEEEARPAAPKTSWKKLLESKPSALDRYDSTAAFATKTWLKHPKFGDGIVLSAGDGKIVVRFEEGERTLASAR